MDFELARRNMIESQIRTWEVLDPQVLDTIAHIKREDFVPPAYRKMAFADFNIPLGHGETMWTPMQEARLLQILELRPSDKVLEVGTGSGYFTALLASLAGHVYSVDDIGDFVDTARVKLAAHGCGNVTLERGDAARGWDFHAPYEAIVVTGSMPLLPRAFKEALSINGRLVAILGKAPVMTVKRFVRVDEYAYAEEDLFETSIRPLRNAQDAPGFVF